MRATPDRDVFTVVRHDGGWAVEHEGQVSDITRDKEVAKASANKRARASFDAGRSCVVRVFGEHGYFDAA
ncbi:MAG: DUF2188 domain-containing protein [Phenylobacterium sp.]|uniref:DUF2188 domain-containing protein n=1 Tax=Phenylobacterium sp. TaxID=1871053 RepID=UPI001A553AF3|nr:DUF2188 domain-containing protein [Phenylobacterium sp.]MBL8772146.1 DUF2188 domain-containing protein [Phenylobacterium sp.]